MKRTVSTPRTLRGSITPPGDKSISHRAAIFSSIADGTARITNFSPGGDCASTLRVLSNLGVRMERRRDGAGRSDSLTVYGAGMDGLRRPRGVLDAGNSGTTMRLMSGVLAGRPYRAVITGDASLRSRPMARIVEPLRLMGARVEAEGAGLRAPLVLEGGELHGIEYALPVASAQVKSALLLAGLRAEGCTVLHQPAASRDHTERMLAAMGAEAVTDGLTVSVRPGRLRAVDVQVPGDISSAAFWLVAAVTHPDAEVRVAGVGVNPTRSGIITVLRAMGADLRLENERLVAGEPVADLVARSSELRGVEVGGAMVPLVLDEIPVLAVAAALASGQTRIRDAAELRHKESDRISATVEWLTGAGVACEERDDGMVIRGGARLSGGTFTSRGDHRIAMALGVAGLVAASPVTVQDADVAGITYPGFWRDLDAISGRQGG
ncbi:MAG: 3-phosphoshikimate 1-carboxyvinyltransferase [Gemmatimonadetes bacterium]|nr:3-phosphoshikimate 1-carboxyvinyltransferase [Gemmatimonadota bacterium]